MKLKECCTFIDYRGKTPEKSEEGYRLLTAKNVKPTGYSDEPREFIPIDSYESVMVRGIPKEGDILFTTEAPLGNVCRIPHFSEPFAVGQRLIVIQPDSKILDYQYMVYKLRSARMQEEIFKRSSGSTVRGIRSKELIEIDFDFPGLDEQQLISKELISLENIIALRKQELDALDELIKARFVEMFGDLADPSCAWDRCKLVEACADSDDIKCGPFGTQLNKDEYTDVGIAVWEIPQINSAFTTKPTHFLTVEKAEQLRAYSLTPGDIAMSRKGNVGRCAIFPEEYPDGIIHSDVLRIRVDSKRVNPMFMMRQLHYSGAVTHQIELVSSGAIMAGVNVTKLKQIYVHIPPIELQKQFADFVKQVDKSKVIMIYININRREDSA